jgi:hypothetical protein
MRAAHASVFARVTFTNAVDLSPALSFASNTGS